MGTSLATAGPLGLLLGYICYSFLFLGAMNAAGEMVSWLPVDGSMVQFAERFVDQSYAFALGWFYVYHGGVVIAAEAVAVAGLIKYWNGSVNSGVWCAVFLVSTVLVVRQPIHVLDYDTDRNTAECLWRQGLRRGAVLARFAQNSADHRAAFLHA